MAVSLYISRIVLRELGVSDYGIYSLVGGFIALFGFLNAAMSSATQRYLTFDLGKKDYVRLQKTFSAALTIHMGIALIVLLFAETLGLWYVNNKMVFPPERTYAVNVVYQFSIAASLLGIIQVPYNALIIAREKMNVFAYISIVEVVLNLAIVFMLVFFASDKLIAYAILTFVVSFIIRMTYQAYCRKQFKESKYKFEWDKAYYKELISYSGWNLFGQSANVLANQGTSVLFNLFHGVTINAAISIANQVNTAVYGFVSNFQQAFNPQITKTYAAEEYASHKRMVLTASKFSLIIMSLMSAPILLFPNMFLTLWLGDNLPEYVTQFVQIVLLYSLIDALSGPFWTSAYAIGRVKKYNIGISTINFLTLPLIYLLLKIGVKPYMAFLTRLFISMSIQAYRYYFVNGFLRFKFKEFIPYIWRIAALFTINIALSLLSGFMQVETLKSFLIALIILEVMLITVVVFIIMTKPERLLIKSYIKK